MFQVVIQKIFILKIWKLIKNLYKNFENPISFFKKTHQSAMERKSAKQPNMET